VARSSLASGLARLLKERIRRSIDLRISRAAATLLLVRHALTDSDQLLCGWHAPQISSKGLHQASQLALRFQREDPLTAIYMRVLRCAVSKRRAPILYATQRSVQLRSGLREIYCGLCEGVPLAEVQRKFPESWHRNRSQEDKNFRWPEGESYVEFTNRVRKPSRTSSVCTKPARFGRDAHWSHRPGLGNYRRPGPCPMGSQPAGTCQHHREFVVCRNVPVAREFFGYRSPGL
jgi:hypothetical protein